MNAHSFNPSSQPRNNILNTLHRINQNSSNNYNIFISTFKYMSTLFTHNYTFSHFFSALNRIGRSTNNPIWKCIKNTTSWLLQQQNKRSHRSIHADPLWRRKNIFQLFLRSIFCLNPPSAFFSDYDLFLDLFQTCLQDIELQPLVLVFTLVFNSNY